MSLFKNTNASVRQIDLQGYNHYFNEEQCLILTRLPLVVRCQILSIQVSSHGSIINLVKNMINFRALHVYWNNEKICEELKLAENNDECPNKTTQTLDQHVQWLKDHLPSTCLVVHDPYCGHNNISIWI